MHMIEVVSVGPFVFCSSLSLSLSLSLTPSEAAAPAPFDIRVGYK